MSNVGERGYPKKKKKKTWERKKNAIIYILNVEEAESPLEKLLFKNLAKSMS